MELNGEHIIKAFEICRGQDLCNECPYEENIDCLRLKEKHAIALMKSQGQKIDELTKDVEWSAKRIIEADKKVVELTEDNEAQAKIITNLIETIKDIQAYTVRKMQERLKEEIRKDDRMYYRVTIDQIAKELLEGTKNEI